MISQSDPCPRAGVGAGWVLVDVVLVEPLAPSSGVLRRSSHCAAAGTRWEGTLWRKAV
jgi:hypothetical protein